MNLFNNSKYGNMLTIILIVSIVAIIGIIGIIGYRIYRTYYIETGAMQAADAFESNLNSNISNNNQLQNNSVGGGIITNVEDTSSSTSGNTTTKYKGFTVIGTIQIPAIDIKYPILEKNTKKSLETSVVLMYTSSGINEIGNTVIIGHNYRNGTMFSNVKKLENGDYIYITDEQGRKVKYTTYKVYQTSGSDGSYISRNTEGKREISLSTCTDDGKGRIIVLAKED